MLVWILFILFVLAMLALDLGVFHRKSHVVGVREALAWSGVWISVALLFSVFVYFGYEHHWLGLGNAPDAVEKSAEFPQGKLNDGRSAVVKYLTGYVVEKSLSVDNIFVIAILFSFFAVPAAMQHRVLFWGILGALVMRGAMIGIGAALIARFAWVLYVFGAFLIITAIKMLKSGDGHADPNRNPLVRWTRKLVPVTEEYHGEHFVVRLPASDATMDGTTDSMRGDAWGGTSSGASPVVSSVTSRRSRAGWALTPLSLALVSVETTDLVFAVDSIPAIFAITADPFLVFTSNVFAILGLRSLYFALAGAMRTFKYLKPALATILAVVGVKMLTHSWLKSQLGEHFNLYLLAVVLGILALGIIASLIDNRRRN